MAKATIPVSELNRFDLPPVCLVTGETEGVSFQTRTLLWTPPWVYLLILVPAGGILLAAVVSLLVRRRVKAELPFSGLGWKRYRLATWLRPLSVLFLLFGWLATMMLLAAGDDAPEHAAALAGIVSAAIPLSVFLTTRKWTVRPTHISQTHATLYFGSDVAAQQLKRHLEGSAALRTGEVLGHAQVG